MSRSFHSSIESSLTAQQIYEAYSSRDFATARLSDTGGQAQMESFVVDGGTVRVVVVQDLAGAVLPGPMKRVHPGGLTIVQTQSWSPVRDQRLCGEVRIEARGVRGSGTGRLVLAPERDAERIACSATFEFKVPLVGGTLENLFGRQFVDQMPESLQVISKWLDEHA